MAPHPDPWRAIDRQPDPARYVRMMESRSRTPHPGARAPALPPVLPDRARVEGAGGGRGQRRGRPRPRRDGGPARHVTGVDRSRVLMAAAHRRAREEGLARRMDFRLG